MALRVGRSTGSQLGATVLDADGKAVPIVMGSYGIGSGRLLASVAEEYHDEYGLTWPVSVAPYQVHMVVLKGAEARADEIYEGLCAAGLEVLYDDRPESPGVKFNDADLIGLPLRITVSQRSLNEQAVELKRRTEKEKELVPVGEAAALLQAEIERLEAQISELVIPMPYDDD